MSRKLARYQFSAPANFTSSQRHAHLAPSPKPHSSESLLLEYGLGSCSIKGSWFKKKAPQAIHYLTLSWAQVKWILDAFGKISTHRQWVEILLNFDPGLLILVQRLNAAHNFENHEHGNLTLSKTNWNSTIIAACWTPNTRSNHKYPNLGAKYPQRNLT